MSWLIDRVRADIAVLVSLLFLFPLACDVVVDAQDGPGTTEGDYGPMAGSRATIYASHPRLLLRDSDWAGGLSVANIKARCQVGTQWWANCQRVMNAGTGIEREIPTYAMKWLLGGSAADADHAISLILTVDVNSNNLLLLSDVSLAYDWLYNYPGFTAQQKAQATDRIDLFAQNMRAYISDRHIWSRFMGYTDSVGLAGLALYGHSPNATGFLDFALGNLTNMFEAFQYINGSWAEGFRYLNIERLPQFLEFLEAYRTASDPTVDYFADIRDNQGDWMRKMLYFHIYNTLPYGEIVRFGDIGQGSLKDNYRRNIDLMTSRLNDSAGGGYLQLLENTANAQPTYYVGYAFEHVLWYDPNVPTTGLDSLPRAMWFGPKSLDYVVMRDGYKSDSTVVTFRSGDGFTGHEHLDNGAFTITTSKPLAIDSGMYAAWGTDHRENYYTRTIAHNAMTIYDPIENFQSPYYVSGLAKDGGQRVWWYYGSSSQQNDKTLSDYLASKYAGTHFETGNITAFETGGDFDYVYGDYSNSYNNKVFRVGTNRAKVQTITRELVYFGPEWLVVMDHAYTLDPTFVTTFNLHMIGEPTISGNYLSGDASGGKTYSGDTATIDNGGDKLFSRTMFPDKYQLTKRGGTGYEYVVANVNRDGGASPDPLAGAWRLEVVDKNATTDHKFLHVMNIQKSGTGGASMPYTSRINEETVLGAYFDGKATIFSKSLDQYDYASINMSENGLTGFHAFNMVPNMDYSVLNIDKKNGWFEVASGHSSVNGTMSFAVNLTGGNQIIIGAKAEGDLSLTDMATSPSTPNEGEDVNISVILNNPTVLPFNTNLTGGQVDFYLGDPAAGGKLIGNSSIMVAPKSTQKVVLRTLLPWDPVTRMVYSQLNMSAVKAFTDTNKANDKTFLPVYINALPIPTIKCPSRAFINQTIMFDGSASFDREGPIRDYRWEFGDGGIGTTEIVSHSYQRTGNFTVVLKLWDLANMMNKTTAKINISVVPKIAPVPDFEISSKEGGAIGDIFTKFVFNSTTKDPDNITEAILWDFGDGAKADGASVSHTYPDDGKYFVNMTIFWNGTMTAWVVKEVVVNDLPPLPIIGATENDTVKGFTINFDALESTDPDDDYNDLTFHWDFGDGKSADGDSVQHAYLRSGTYNVTLTAKDPKNATGVARALIKISNRLPKAVIKASNTTLAWNETLQLDGAQSSDPDGETLEYRWDFGDNSTYPVDKNASHRFASEGYYTVSLTVRDTDNGVDRATITIHQLAKPDDPPPPPKPKKKDNTMLYVGIGAGVGILLAVVALLLMLRRRKGSEIAPERSSTELSVGLEVPQGPADEAVPPAVDEPEDVPRAKATAVRPETKDRKGGAK